MNSENESALQREKFIKMTEYPVERLICRLAVPTVISMMITSIYNMSDTYFVGKLENVSATGAVGVVFPLMTIIQAVGFFFGHGSGNYMSRELGKHHLDTSKRMASVGFFSSVLCCAVLACIGMLFIEPFCLALGSTNTILPFAKEYMTYILISAPVMAGSLVINNQLRFQGNALYAMFGITSGAILNIILDPVFIFVLDMGIKGAAAATAISQCVSLVLLIAGMLKSDAINISPRYFRPSVAVYKELVKGGLPSLARQGLGSVSTVMLNSAAKAFNDPAIAAVTIVSRFMTVLSSALIGFGQGYQPVCGFNYGAGLYDRVRRAFWFCVKSSVGFLLALSALGFIFAPQILMLFQADSQTTVQIGAAALRYQLLTLPLMSWVTMCNMTLQTVGKTSSATVIAMSRQGIMFIPCIIILPAVFDLNGLIASQPVADLLSLAISIPVMIAFLRELSRRQTSPSTETA